MTDVKTRKSSGNDPCFSVIQQYRLLTRVTCFIDKTSESTSNTEQLYRNQDKSARAIFGSVGELLGPDKSTLQ